MCISYKPGRGPESQLRYNINVHCLEIQDVFLNVDIEYKIKTYQWPKIGCSYISPMHSFG